MENKVAGGTGGGSQNKSKREQMFEEINTIIGYMKRLEIEIAKCVDTPCKMFKILK
jgi:hypothetical protein